jgi:hypothetical protein
MHSNIGFIVTILLLGELATSHHHSVNAAPLFPLPFLRGGSSTTAVATRRKSIKKQKQLRPRRPGVNPIQLAGNVKRGLDKVGNKMQQDVSNTAKNIGRGLAEAGNNTRKFVANIPKIIPHPLRRRQRLKANKLDEVCNTFASVLRGDEVDTAQLIKACKAHLAFMKSGGSSLRLVAKDLESNVQKAERVYKKNTKEGKCLSSLLECEKESGVHNGNELQEKSAAMGLLWIRRSLAFQLDLYSSLIYNEIHPRDAAYNAYTKHLSPFHGWALRKVFPASLANMPDRQTFIAKFGGISVEELNEEYDKMVAKKLKTLVKTWDPLIGKWESEFERLGLEDTRRV